MTSAQMINPSDQRIFADMTSPTPAINPSAEAASSAELHSAARELVGRRGSAPIEKSRTAADLLVSGKRSEPLGNNVDTVRAGAVQGAVQATAGIDGRRQVHDTDLTPWRMVCALRMRSSTGAEAMATGWLAGPRTIITAGHHVHNQEFFGGWAESIEVSAGRNCTTAPFSRFTASHFTATDRWVNGADPDFNFGCIQLDLPLGDLTGWFGVASLAPSELESALVNVSGYPAGRDDGTGQYFHANRILHADDRHVFYDIPISGAQTGAPVWIHRTPSAPPVVVALQAHGAGGTPFDQGIASNSAPRITPEIFDMIKKWIHEDISVAA